MSIQEEIKAHEKAIEDLKQNQTKEDIIVGKAYVCKTCGNTQYNPSDYGDGPEVAREGVCYSCFNRRKAAEVETRLRGMLLGGTITDLKTELSYDDGRIEKLTVIRDGHTYRISMEGGYDDAPYAVAVEVEP